MLNEHQGGGDTGNTDRETLPLRDSVNPKYPQPSEPRLGHGPPRVMEHGERQASSHEDERNHQQQPARDYTNRMMVTLTAIIALSTVGQAYISCSGGQSMSQQVDRLIGASDKLAASAEGGLGQAKSMLKQSAEQNEKVIAQGRAALDESISNSRNSQRPWVGPVEISPPVDSAPGSPVFLRVGPPATFELVVGNSGSTPALETRAIIRVVTRPADRKFVPDYSVRTGSPSSGILYPNMELRLQTNPTSPITEAYLKAVSSGAAIMEVFGRISYKDMFGGQHVTTFCFALNPSLRSFGACPITMMPTNKATFRIINHLLAHYRPSLAPINARVAARAQSFIWHDVGFGARHAAPQYLLSRARCRIECGGYRARRATSLHELTRAPMKLCGAPLKTRP